MRVRFWLTIFIFLFPLFIPGISFAQGISFFVDKTFDPEGRDRVEADFEYVSDNLRIYVEKKWHDPLFYQERLDIREKIINLAKEFDDDIYPKMTSVFGQEWKPGIDQDSRIAVLIMPMKKEVGGYFRPEDEYPRNLKLNSNQREMIYFNSAKISDSKTPAYLAHEFQHLITFYQKTKLRGATEETWLDEARSEYAPTLCGYNQNWEGSYLKDRVGNFLSFPSDSLTDWNQTENDFGTVSLFIHYLVENFGQAILTGMIQNSKVGIESINQALKDLGKSETFDDVFTDWTVANYLNDGEYKYLNPNLVYNRFHVSPQATYTLFSGAEIFTSFAVRNWSAQYYKILPGVIGRESDFLKIEFSTSKKNTNFKIPMVITDFSGKSRIDFLTVIGPKGLNYISGFGKNISSLILIPSNQMSSDGGLIPFSLNFSLVQNAPDYRHHFDGMVVRLKQDPRVYVILGKYKRWFQSPEIFTGYGHLQWEDIIEIDDRVLNLFEESQLVKALDSPKVYSVSPQGTKHWLNMTPRDFERKGYRWDQIYIVNENEINWFSPGADIR